MTRAGKGWERVRGNEGGVQKKPKAGLKDQRGWRGKRRGWEGKPDGQGKQA
jgi:hypothetical protein